MVCAPFSAIIFDFGGVLINWEPQHIFSKYFANDSQAIDNFLAEINFADWNLSQDKGHPFSQAVKEHSARFPQYTRPIQAYNNEWEQSITGIIQGTVEIIEKLKVVGCRLYGLSNWSAEKFTIVRQKFEVFNLFEEIVISGEVKLLKPDPAIFRLLLRRIKRQPEECLLVDDSLPNILTAQKMGFFTHHFTSPALLELYLQQAGIL
jgi:2-haloacid dehalogenase